MAFRRRLNGGAKVGAGEALSGAREFFDARDSAGAREAISEWLCGGRSAEEQKEHDQIGQRRERAKSTRQGSCGAGP